MITAQKTAGLVQAKRKSTSGATRRSKQLRHAENNSKVFTSPGRGVEPEAQQPDQRLPKGSIADPTPMEVPEQAEHEPQMRTSQPERDGTEKIGRSPFSSRNIPSVRDFALQPYMGWNIEGPKVQLRRALNFLADEDIDRTPDWERKCAALAEYFSYLLANLKDEDWGHDLKEAITMLRTHRLVEQYHYEKPQLSLEFANGLPTESTRLLHPAGPRITLDFGDQPPNETRNKNLLPGIHASVHGLSHNSAVPSEPSSMGKSDAGVLINPYGGRPPKIPTKELRDPFSYVRAHEKYKRRDLQGAEQAKRTAAGSDTHEKPMTELVNWKGPKTPGPSDARERKVLELLQNYRGLCDALKRQRKRAPRKFMDEVLRHIDLGRGVNLGTIHLRFRAADYSKSATSLAPVRKYEVLILRRLCQQSYKRPEAPSKPLDAKGRLLATRVAKMLADPNPKSHFRNTKQETLEKFVIALNEYCGGRVQQYKFKKEEVSSNLPTLAKLGLLEFWASKSNCWISRPKPDIHPEDRIIWPGQLHLDSADWDIESSTESHSDEAPLPIDWTYDEDIRGIKSVPLSEIVRSLEECFYAKDQIAKRREMTENFFYCLAYRLGRTMAALEPEAREIEEAERSREAQQNSPGLRKRGTNTGSRDSSSTDEAGEHTEELSHESSMYRHTVMNAEPDSFQSAWNKDDGSFSSSDRGKQALIEGHYRHIVRRNIVREAHENRTMLWPTEIGTYQAVNTDKVEVFRREPIWSFGHPSVRPRAPRFWSLDRWPVELQSKEAQEIIRASGSQMPEEGEGPGEKGADGTASRETPNPTEGEVRVTWAETAAAKRTFQPGPIEFWRGDTPRQKRAIEKNLRARFESRRQKKRTWRSLLFGSRQDDEGSPLETEQLKLPDMPDELIPRSVPWSPDAEDFDMEGSEMEETPEME